VGVLISLPRPHRRRTVGTKTRLRVELLESRMLLSVDLGITLDGTNANNSSCGCIPPDTDVTNGPNQVIESVNSALMIYDKNTGAVSRTALRTFFAPLGGVLSLSDPVVMYDDINGQFVIGVLDFSGSTVSRFDLAVSYDSDYNDGFYMQRYDMRVDPVRSTNFADYPKAGYNADAYVFSFNMFPNPVHVSTLTVDKSTLTGYLKNVTGSHFTMTPAVMHGSNPGDPMWFVENGNSTNMKVVMMTNILSANPTYTVYIVPVPSYSGAPSAVQPGGSPTIDTLSNRVLNAAYNGGLLVGAHSIGSGGCTLARWYEFDTTTAPPTLVQSGNIDQGPGVYTFFPTIEINSEYDLGVTFTESSTSEFFSMYVTGQSVYDYGSGTMQTPVLTHAGNSHYSGGGIPARAGDYSGISVDPNDGYTFWAANEYKGNALWNTGVAGFGVSPNLNSPAPAAFTPAVMTTQRVAPAPSTVADVNAAQSERPATAAFALLDRLFVESRANADLATFALIRDQANGGQTWLEELAL